MPRPPESRSRSYCMYPQSQVAATEVQDPFLSNCGHPSKHASRLRPRSPLTAVQPTAGPKPRPRILQ